MRVNLLQALLDRRGTRSYVVRDAREKYLIELRNILLVANLNLVAWVVYDRFEYSAGLDIAFIAVRHQREHKLEFLDHRPTWLNSFRRKIVTSFKIFVVELENSLYEVGQTVVDLEKRVEVARVSNVSQSDSAVRLSYSLL